MSRARPFILWRHITVELWRVLLLTVSVLVVVIAFAAAVKPLADGKLSPAQAIRFMILAVPPMLAYALPFSAGFAATLTYHRMAHDNELLAAHAGGISHRAILAPALATGLILLLTLAALNEYIIPRFLQSMERLVAQDLTKLMVHSFERGQAIENGNLMIFADDVLLPSQETKKRLAAEQGITDALELEGVVFVELDSKGAVRHEAVVRKAEVYISPTTDQAGAVHRVASIIPIDGAGRIEDTEFFSFDQLDPIIIDLPNAFHDNPKFLTWGELRRLRQFPDRMDFIRVRSQDLAHHLAERDTTAAINADLHNTGQVKFQTSGNEPMVLHAGGIHWNKDANAWLVLPNPNTNTIEIEWFRMGEDGAPGGGGITQLTPKRALLRTNIGKDRTNREMTITLKLFETRVASSVADVGSDLGDDNAPRQPEILKEGLKLAYDPLPDLLNKNAHELLTLANSYVDQDAPVPFIQKPIQNLKREILSLDREITSKQQERWAFAVSCFLMVLAGAIIAIKFSQSPPLGVYMWSFFPALTTVITIVSGQQVVHNTGAPGLLLLWGGVVALAGYILLAYFSIRKH